VGETRCAACGRRIQPEEGDAARRVPCPGCGSTARVFREEAVECLSAYDGVRVRHRRPSVRTDKPVFEGFRGHQPRRDPARPGLVYKDEFIDRVGNRRYELVVDAGTGEVERRVDHPLTEHRGRGSAKPRPPR
jgi:predicted RNA-binding Zn-ribbon protein involved in translation (DUF1610 family)